MITYSDEIMITITMIIIMTMIIMLMMMIFSAVEEGATLLSTLNPSTPDDDYQ